MSAQTASTAAKAVAASPQAAAASSALQRYAVQPVVNFLHKVEARSVAKVAAVTEANAKVRESIAAHDAAGTDAAAASTRRFLQEQRSLVHYRVVRAFHEGRHVFTGAHFKDYNYKKALIDLRFLTEALLIFIIAVIVGRASVYPPIAPDSPLAVALQHKVNPNY